MASAMVKLICCFFIIVVLRDRGARPQPQPQCDRWRRTAHEGVLGSVRVFPWLGVLRVHLHHETSLKIALTGVVLVKERHAIANADDVARIPKRIFQEDSRVMFVPAEREPWFCRPVDYVTHPEYELETLNTIALIELDAPPHATLPMKPVCWPPSSYNVTNDLYAVGYTDENQLLEKFVYQLSYVKKELCKEFYSRAGLTEGKTTPLHYECGFAANNKESCVWDNGMALVSNSSGFWVLIGLGLQGPGCAAPSRFVSLAEYYPWIESTTDLQLRSELAYRKSAYNEGFKSSQNVVEYIPAHELLRSEGDEQDARRQNEYYDHYKHDFAHYYPFDVKVEDLFAIDRISATEIEIKMAKNRAYRLGKYGNCKDDSNQLMYQDYTNVTAAPRTLYSGGRWGTVHYKMSLHDSVFEECTCVTIKLHVKQADPGYLYYDTEMEDLNLFPETSEDIIRHHPFYTQTRLVKQEKKAHFVPAPIQSSGITKPYSNVNLYLKVIFSGECRLEVGFYGPFATREVTTTSEPTTTATKKKTTTTDPYSGLRKYIPLEVVESEAHFRDVAAEGAPVYSRAGAGVAGARMLLCFVCGFVFILN